MSTNKQTTQNIQEAIRQEFGFNDLSDAQQMELVNQMTESVIKRVLVDAYAELNEDDQKKFEEMMENIENTDPESMEGFLRERLPIYDELVKKAVADLKEHLGKSQV